MGIQSNTEKTRPVPGGKSQKGTRSALPSYGKGTANVGKGRGIIGGGTPDVHGRAPSSRSAPGNYGGGYAGVDYGPGRRPKGANRRG